jgi:hypothetical protein
VGSKKLKYSQVDAITGVLDGLANSVDRYVLYTFNGVGHSEFGEGQKVYPNTTYDNEWGVNEIIDDYYDEISSKLQGLAQQED